MISLGISGAGELGLLSARGGEPCAADSVRNARGRRTHESIHLPRAGEGIGELAHPGGIVMAAPVFEDHTEGLQGKEGGVIATSGPGLDDRQPIECFHGMRVTGEHLPEAAPGAGTMIEHVQAVPEFDERGDLLGRVAEKRPLGGAQGPLGHLLPLPPGTPPTHHSDQDRGQRAPAPPVRPGMSAIFARTGVGRGYDEMVAGRLLGLMLGAGAMLAMLGLVLGVAAFADPRTWPDAMLMGILGGALLVAGGWFIDLIARTRPTQGPLSASVLSWIIALTAALTAGALGGSLVAACYAFAAAAALSIPLSLVLCHAPLRRPRQDDEPPVR